MAMVIAPCVGHGSEGEYSSDFFFGSMLCFGTGRAPARCKIPFFSTGRRAAVRLASLGQKQCRTWSGRMPFLTIK